MLLFLKAGTVSHYAVPIHLPAPRPPALGVDTLAPSSWEPKSRSRACGTVHAHVLALRRVTRPGVSSVQDLPIDHQPPYLLPPRHDIFHPLSPKSLCNLQALGTQRTERLRRVPRVEPSPRGASVSPRTTLGARKAVESPQRHRPFPALG